MTIHADFWRERKRDRQASFARLGKSRDSNRQRCYNWENKCLRPFQKAMTRQEAKGYARLCVKAAIRTMRETGLIKSDAVADMVRASFTAAFTTETIGHCNANAQGAYFAKWGWTDVIIAHEVAHWADQWAHKLRGGVFPAVVTYEPHGPRWRGWFLHLLKDVGMRDRSKLAGLLDAEGMPARSMAEAGLRFILPTA